jgi:hypothetical protein
MSEIKVDTLTGKTTAGDITVTSEGGAATQSLQQGLAKAWVEAVTVTSHVIQGSLNVSSLTDGGTGAFDAVTYTSAMANDDYAVATSCGNEVSADSFITRYVQTTAATGGRARTYNGNLNDANLNSFIVFGDLA